MHIEHYPNYSFLRQAPPILSRQLDERLSFRIEGIQFSKRFRSSIRSGAWDGKTHFFSRISGRFPTGLLPIVQEFTKLEESDIHHYEGYQIDKLALMKAQEVAETIQLRGIHLSGLQREAIKAGVQPPGRGKFLFATNSGKSEVGIGLVESIGLPALWVTSRKDLLYQYAERYKERTGKEAGLIGDGIINPRDLTVGIVSSIKWKENEEIGKFLSGVKVLIVDECSHAQSKTWFDLCMATTAPFRFGLTGTEPDDELKRHRIWAATGSSLLGQVSNSELISSGWSATPTIHLQTVEYPRNHMDYQSAYDEMIRSNIAYNTLIVNEVEKHYKEGKTILVIVDRIRQGSFISSELSGRKVPATFLTGSHQGDYRNKVLRDFRSGKVPIVIATSIFDEGVDVPAIEVLILAAGGLSKGRQLQRIGRALRRKEGENTVTVVDYVHMGNEYLAEHSVERVKIYEAEGFKLVWRDPVNV